MYSLQKLFTRSPILVTLLPEHAVSQVWSPTLNRRFDQQEIYKGTAQADPYDNLKRQLNLDKFPPCCSFHHVAQRKNVGDEEGGEMRRATKKMMQIEEDGEEDEEDDEDKLCTSPTIPTIQELMFVPLQMLVLLWIASCSTAFGLVLCMFLNPKSLSFFTARCTCSPPHVAISHTAFNSLATFGIKVLARFEDASLYSELYLELHPFHLKLNTPRDPRWANRAWS